MHVGRGTHGLTMAAALGVVTLLAGCSNGESEAAPASTVTVTATVAATSTVTVAPVETTWTKKVAGERYLAIVAKTNAANKKLTEVSGADRDFETAKAACVKVADADTVAIGALRTGKWPEEVQADIDQLIKDFGQDLAGNGLCANALSEEAMEEGFRVSQQGQTGAGAAIRAVLGLPPPE